VGTTTIVLAQNGINIERPFIDRFPTNSIISSVVYTGAEEIAPAKIHHTDPDWQKIGPYHCPGVSEESVEKSAKRFVNILDPKGKRMIFYDADVSGVRWRKLAYNASFNSVAAALQIDTSRLRMSQHLIDDLILPIILEVQAAAASCGVMLQSDLVKSVMQQDVADSFYRPSMMQDVINRNFMEIETIVGEPLREGKRHGIAMPTLSVVYGILRGLQLRIKEEKGLWQPKYEPGNPYM
jgi:2-dehydropantoate 2-reductase